MREMTTSTILALHALHFMLRENRPVRASTISRLSGFDRDLARQILQKLCGALLVQHLPGDGYLPLRSAGEISILDVIQAMDEPTIPKAPCGGDFDACPTRGSCVMARLCQNVDRSSQDALRSFTLAELLESPLDVPNCVDPKVACQDS